MWRTIGYLFLVIAIGGVAMAWSKGTGPRTATTQATTISPNELHLNARALPGDTLSDMSFVFTGEE